MNYGEILGKSWKIFWQHKLLWLVGVLPNLLYSLVIILLLVLFNPMILETIPDDLLIEDWVVYLSLFLIFIFELGYIVVVIFSITAGSVGVKLIEQGELPLTLARLLKESSHYFWRILGINFILGFVLSIFYLVIYGGITLAVVLTYGVALFCFTPFFFLLLPVNGFILLLTAQSHAAIIVEDLGLFQGLKRGWEVLHKNFWKLVLLGLILYMGFYLFTLLVTTPLSALIMGPTMFSLFTDNPDAIPGILSGTMIGLAVIYPIYLLFTGLVTAFIRSVWTLAFLRLTQSFITSEPIIPEVPNE